MGEGVPGRHADDLSHGVKHLGGEEGDVAVHVAGRLVGRPDAPVPVAAVDLGIRLVAAQVRLPPARLHDRARAALPLDQDDAVVVDGIAAVRGADRREHALRLGLAEQEARGVDGVDAHVDERPAAGQRRVGEPAPRAPVGMHAVAVRAHDRAELAREDRVAQRDHGAVVPPGVQHEQQPVVTLRLGEHRLGVGDGRRHRLLAENVLARLERRDRLLGVQRVGSADHDDVDVRRTYQLAPVGRGALDLVFGREALGRFEPVVGNAGDRVAAGRRRPRVHVRDPAAAEQREPCRHAPAPIGIVSMIAAACSRMRAAASATSSTRSRSASSSRCSIQTVEAAACSATGRCRLA